MVAPPAWRLGRLPVLPAWRVRPCTLAGSGDPETHAPSSFRRRGRSWFQSLPAVPMWPVRSAIMCGRHGLGCFGDGPFGCLPVVPGASLPANCNQVRRARIGKVLALAVALSAPLCMTAISDLRLLALLLSCTDLYGTRQTAATCATPGGLDLRTMECGKYLLYLIGMILLKTQCQK